MRFARIGFLAALAVGLLTACAVQTTSGTAEPPGFWLGLVHGFILPFALIAELFTNAHVYAFPNSGGRYDLGFVLGAAAVFSGSGGGLVRVSLRLDRSGDRPQGVHP